MKYTGVLEKLECIYKLISSSIIYPIFLGFLAILILLLITKKLKNTKGLILTITSYIALSTTVIINNSKELGKVFDDISTNLFTNIYFPSAYTYFFILVIIDIITIKSLLNFKESKAYKITNSIFFFIIQFIFILIMDFIGKNNIDIFTKKSLFSSKSLIILLESSINVFILWLVSLLIIYITNKIVEIINIRNTTVELETAPVMDINNNLVVEDIPTTTTNNNLVVETIPDTNIISEETPETTPVYNTELNIPVYDNTEIYNNTEINTPVTQIVNNINTNPMNINLTYEEPTTNDEINNKVDDSFSLNDLIFSKQNTILENNNIEENHIDNNILLNQFLNNDLPLIHESDSKVEHQEKKEDYTLNDYRIFNKILKDIRETNNSNIISINKELELKLINKYTEDEYNLFKVMLKEYSN